MKSLLKLLKYIFNILWGYWMLITIVSMFDSSIKEFIQFFGIAIILTIIMMIVNKDTLKTL